MKRRTLEGKDYVVALLAVMLCDHGDDYAQCANCEKPTHKRYACTHCGDPSGDHRPHPVPIEVKRTPL